MRSVQAGPGRLLQSVAESSFDAWIKYYRQDENSPNTVVSYYVKGSLVALCLDLTLRQEGHTTLDAVMRALWQRCKAGPMHEADLLEIVNDAERDRFREIGARHVVELAKPVPHPDTEAAAACPSTGVSRRRTGPGMVGNVTPLW